MRVLAIPGSVRRESYNRKLLLNAAELLGAEHEFVLYEDLKQVPPYDEEDDREPAPAVIAALRAAIAGADALLISTPEYNSSVPGQLKNALDWASRPIATSVLRNKPAIVVGASTGAFGAVWSQAELRKVLAAAGARVLEAEVAVGHAPERFDDQGRLVDAELREQLSDALAMLGAGEPRSQDVPGLTAGSPPDSVRTSEKESRPAFAIVA